MTKKRKYVVMLVTAPSVASARKIARALLDARAAACVNIVPRIESHYRWQGKIESTHEVLLLIKTAQVKTAQVTRLVRHIHPYQVPEIIALPISHGLPAYLRWIEENL